MTSNRKWKKGIDLIRLEDQQINLWYRQRAENPWFNAILALLNCARRIYQLIISIYKVPQLFTLSTEVRWVRECCYIYDDRV